MPADWRAKGAKLHTRRIEVATYHYDDQRVIVEGTLRDDRFQDYHSITGDRHPPGAVHQMTIRLLVNGFSLEIEDVGVEMPTVPDRACLETIGCLEAIKGLTITRGFTAKAKKLAGGKRGCTHLMELLLVMAPIAFQGILAYRGQKPADVDPERARRVVRSLVDTCYAWSDEGPFLERFKGCIDPL